MKPRVAALLSVMLAAATLLGCGDEFEPFNRLSADVRVLAIAAEPAGLTDGGSTELTPLVYAPATGPAAELEWSWCPVTRGPSSGYECAVTEDQLAQALASAPGLSFDLGSGPTATLDAPFPAAVGAALCEALFSDELPDFIDVPDCSRALPLTVKLVARAGESEVVAVTEVPLLLDPAAVPNGNPSLGTMRIGLDEAPESAAVEVAEDGSTTVTRGESYRLWLDVPADAVETFTPAPTVIDPEPAARPESLIFTWFTSAGETGFTRTVFTEELPLEAARQNSLEVPLDVAADVLDVRVVVRDGRGGLGWTTRMLQVVGP